MPTLSDVTSGDVPVFTVELGLRNTELKQVHAEVPGPRALAN